MEDITMRKISLLIFISFLFIAISQESYAQSWPVSKTLIRVCNIVDSLRSLGEGNFGIGYLLGTYLKPGQSSVFGSELTYNQYFGFVLYGDENVKNYTATIYDDSHEVQAESESYGDYQLVRIMSPKSGSYKFEVQLNSTYDRSSAFIGVAYVQTGSIFNLQEYVNAAKNLEDAYYKLAGNQLSNYNFNFASDPEFVDNNYSNTYSFCLNGMYVKRSYTNGMNNNGMSTNSNYCILSSSSAGAKKIKFTAKTASVTLGTATGYSPIVIFNSGKNSLYDFSVENLESYQDLFVMSCVFKISK